MKHGEHIMAVRHDAVADILDEGFHPFGDQDRFLDLHTLFDEDTCGGLVLARRMELETDQTFRQLLPYVVLSRKNRQGEEIFLTYQRTKGVGEDRLLGKCSIGVGGHVDFVDVRTGTNAQQSNMLAQSSVINLPLTLKANVLREMREEVTFFESVNFGPQFSLSTLVDEAAIAGAINDLSDNVGMHHLGIVVRLDLPEYVYAEVSEESLKQVGWFTVAELKEMKAGHTHALENWSNILIEQML